MHEENTLANQLDEYDKARRAAAHRVTQLTSELERAQTENQRLQALYRRCALWIKADELRKELARVEAEAENIRADNAPPAPTSFGYVGP